MHGCGEKAAQVGETCDIQLSGIHFTRCLNNAAQHVTMNADRIIIAGGAKTDYFNDPEGSAPANTAPVLLSEVDNTKPFTFAAKVTPSFDTTYDAGTFYIFSSNQLWQKFAFEMDERGRTRIVSVRTMDTSDDNNHDVITQETVYLKISSDTKKIGLYYSTDNINWNLARLYKNNYPETVWLGISSQSPIGEGNTTVFEDCSLTDVSVKDFRMGV